MKNPPNVIILKQQLNIPMFFFGISRAIARISAESKTQSASRKAAKVQGIH
jgi:hypothetical protein